MVRDREDANLIADNSVDDAERETPRHKTPFAVTPHGAEAWVPQEEFNGALELREEGLR